MEYELKDVMITEKHRNCKKSCATMGVECQSKKCCYSWQTMGQFHKWSPIIFNIAKDQQHSP